MKRIAVVLLVALMMLTLSGCVPGIIKAGEERDLALYGARVQAQSINVARDIALANVPACKFIAVPGEAITFSGLQEFACYGGSGGAPSSNVEITQRISPFWAWSTQNMGMLSMLAFTGLLMPDGIQSAVVDRQVVEQDRVVPVRPQIVDPIFRPVQ